MSVSVTEGPATNLAMDCWRRCLSVLLPPCCTVDGGAANGMWERYIVSRYSEPRRFYHTMEHIEEMLTHLLQYQKGTLPDHQLPEEGPRRLVVELAVLFHDVVYDPGCSDNEQRSADWFTIFWEDCRELASSHKGVEEDVDEPPVQRCNLLIWDNPDVATDVKTKVVEYILCTKNHLSVSLCYRRDIDHRAEGTSEVGDPPPDLHLFLDLDLAILGSEASRYKRYASDVRREYGWYSDEEFSRGRVAFLRGFLGHPQWYKTKYFCDTMEETARANTEAELKLLEKNLGGVA